MKKSQKIKGMYGFGGFGEDVCDYTIYRFNLHLSAVGIEQAIKNYWRAAIEREDPKFNVRYFELTAWKLERAITLRGKVVTCTNAKTGYPGAWAAASSPPETEPGSWSREVIGLTNRGNVFKVCHRPGNNTGPWRWPEQWKADGSAFIAQGEMIKWWIDKPDNE